MGTVFPVTEATFLETVERHAARSHSMVVVGVGAYVMACEDCGARARLNRACDMLVLDSNPSIELACEGPPAPLLADDDVDWDIAPGGLQAAAFIEFRPLKPVTRPGTQLGLL